MARRHRKPDAALDLLAKHESKNEIAAANALQLAERQQRRRERRGRMYHGRDMGIAEVEHVGAGGIEKRRAQRVDALAPSDNRRLPAAGEHSERGERDLDRLGAAPGQRDSEEIQQ